MTMDPKCLFLDLEDTVITPIVSGWSSWELINLPKIRRIIKEFEPTNVNIFSFAIHDDKDLSGFKTEVQPFLEQALNVKINHVPSVPQILKGCMSTMKLHADVSFQDMRDFWGKGEAFRLYIRSQRVQTVESTQVLLVDDQVLNETWHWPSLLISGQTLNVNEL